MCRLFKQNRVKTSESLGDNAGFLSVSFLETNKGLKRMHIRRHLTILLIFKKKRMHNRRLFTSSEIVPVELLPRRR
ncbi:hypothetical protein BC351_23555 [Paenibacillus ferrarius]|uniref:Uncharacterized protein n=1 Tax=Paenibacillus ferrarius TaxID=1469647 RepID=A0A1V4HMJ9_9BACL|nr:hypothetical protein BC351_23555 [Paenibacillus ferrarius]